MGVEEPTFEPKRILIMRWGWQGHNKGLNMLVKWLGRSEEEATWISEANFLAQFPHFSHKDKVGVEGGGGNVTGTARGPPLKVYTKRTRTDAVEQ